MTTALSDLLTAVQSGDLARVRASLHAEPGLAAGRAPDGVSFVLHALYRGQRSAADLLLAARLALDGFTAAAVGDTDRLRALLDADPAVARQVAPDGFTALHLAAFFGQLESAALLLERGAETDAVAQNTMRVQPLHSAAAGRHLAVCALLLRHGADVNARQQAGWTALHAAAQHGGRCLITLLLEHGADPGMENDTGATPAATAAASGQTEVLALLEPGAGPRLVQSG